MTFNHQEREIRKGGSDKNSSDQWGDRGVFGGLGE